MIALPKKIFLLQSQLPIRRSLLALKPQLGFMQFLNGDSSYDCVKLKKLSYCALMVPYVCPSDEQKKELFKIKFSEGHLFRRTRTFVWKDICSKRQFVWNDYGDGIFLGKHKIDKEKIGQTNRIVMILWYFVTKIVLTYCEKKLFQ